MTNPNPRPPALIRAAEAMLRALGGAEVKLRCPVAPAKDQQARQLGLEAPVTEDIAISPVVGCPTLTRFGRAGNGHDDLELLIAPASIAQYIEDRGQSADQFFDAVLGVFVADREFNVQSLQAERFADVAYLYRLTLKAKS